MALTCAFRSVAPDLEYDAEMWFDQEFGQDLAEP